MVRLPPPQRKSVLNPQQRRDKRNQQRRERRVQRKGLSIDTSDLIVIPYVLIPPTITTPSFAERRFLETVLDELQAELTAANNSDCITWGQHTASNVQKYLLRAVPIQVPSVDETQAAAMLASGERIVTPIFVESQAMLPWKDTTSRIRQVLDLFPDSDEVFVNISSLEYQPEVPNSVSHKKVSMEDLKAHLTSHHSSTESWNVLDLNVPFPETWGTCPRFLQNDNCSLLSRMKDRMFSSGSAVRPTSSCTRKIWREVERWLLLASAGANTMTHQDAFGYDTHITILEGEIGFAWLNQPPEHELIQWAQAPFDLDTGHFYFTVLRTGMTVFFPSGTVHLVVRIRNQGPQTLGLGGHLLRYSNILGWIRTVNLQLQYPDATNEDMEPAKVVEYLELMVDLIIEIKGAKTMELFGGDIDFKSFAEQIEAR